jgi:RNA polymerase sigma-70 factor (ECF subfamily)
MTVGDARFVGLYERYYRHVYAYCRRRITADRVEDVVAETFLVAWRKIEKIPTDDKALAWLYTVAYRVVGRQWRGVSRQSRLETKLNSVGVPVVESAEEFVVLDHDSRQALAALSKLRDSDQEILRLSVWEELTHAEIGDVLDLNTDAVKKRFSRARKKLAQELNRMENIRSKPPAVQKGGAW